MNTVTMTKLSPSDELIWSWQFYDQTIERTEMSQLGLARSVNVYNCESKQLALGKLGEVDTERPKRCRTPR